MNEFNAKNIVLGAFLGAGLALSTGEVFQALPIRQVEVVNLPLSVNALSPLPIKEPILFAPSTNQWTYLVQTISTQTDEGLTQVLQESGSNGWELVSVRTNQFIFKKPLASKYSP
jgi:hypothetical protein